MPDMTEPVVILTVFLTSTVFFAAVGLGFYTIVKWTSKEIKG